MPDEEKDIVVGRILFLSDFKKMRECLSGRDVVGIGCISLVVVPVDLRLDLILGQVPNKWIRIVTDE